jgi:hypothetical protein
VDVGVGPGAAEFDHAVGAALRQIGRQVDTHFLQRCQVLASLFLVLSAKLLLGLGVVAVLLAGGRPLGFLLPGLSLLTLPRQVDLGLHLDRLLRPPPRRPVHLRVRGS